MPFAATWMFDSPSWEAGNATCDVAPNLGYRYFLRDSRFGCLFFLGRPKGKNPCALSVASPSPNKKPKTPEPSYLQLESAGIATSPRPAPARACCASCSHWLPACRSRGPRPLWEVEPGYPNYDGAHTNGGLPPITRNPRTGVSQNTGIPKLGGFLLP